MWEFEIEELDHIIRIFNKLKDPEDKQMIMSLVEKISIGCGFRDGVEQTVKMFRKSGEDEE